LGKPLPYRLIGYSWEKDQGKFIFHIQIDVESTGYMESSLRNPGSEIEILVYRSKNSQ
jgi:hypothetical protein